ncbi:MAG: hypothetical protein ABR54_06815 [Actinobacteria bacterium BACL15 MAG-120619-bin91]|jgi:hypothetical protein|uniref:Uncharacterized protein n=2 Tax=ac1 cluster TaxID=1655545 RepID=A0A0R2PN14_9ACTN|nr:MAG: hypothetical protein ABR54_06815 [Actinobacteria bacterium BACL15 MAG-120619-bin91]KRO38347.1 MAG: hypothetical protein ABR55_01480 [Actinobacteria bacterium BACL15 MAG-120823-bin78]
MRRVLSALAIASLALSLTGCGAGLNASTRQITQVTDGAEAQIIGDGNNIRVVNLLVVAAGGGTGVLVGTIVNAADEEDSLLGVAINGSVLTYTGRNVLPKNSPIIFEGDRANAKAVLTGFGAKAGTNVSVTMFFARAGEVTRNVLVRENKDEYAGIAP